MHFNHKMLEKLDQLGEDWYAAKQRGDDAACQSMTMELFNLLATPVVSNSRRMDAITTFVLNIWSRGAFDPSLSPLSKYVSYNIRHYCNWDIEDGVVFGKKTVTSVKRGQTKEMEFTVCSGDHPVDEDGEGDPLFSLVPSGALDAEETLVQEQTLSRLFFRAVSLALNIAGHLSGQAKNPQRFAMYRMFFTDRLTYFLSVQKELTPYLQHERDLFEALDTDFMDFLLDRICRTIPQIAAAERRPYSQLVPDSKERACSFPLNNTVFYTYLQGRGEHISVQRVSQLRKDFSAFVSQHAQTAAPGEDEVSLRA